MKNIEIFFGNTEEQKNVISNIWNKHFQNSQIEFRTAQENPFCDEISHYGSVKIKEEEEAKFQTFFSEYHRFLK